MDTESFNFVISSDDRVNTTANQIYYDLDMGMVNSSHSNFIVEVIQIVLNGNILGTNGYLLFTAEGLADNGLFCRNKLSSSQAVLGVISANIDGLMCNTPTTFLANNIRMKKRVRFSLLKPDFSPVVSGVDINIGDETRWVLTLKMTPKLN
jgi:hypothetical protein